MKRNESIDIAKGIGIILVVLGHLNHYIYLNNTYKGIHDFIFMFHMPLFFLLSGFTLKIYEESPMKTLFRRRLNSLIRPFVIGCIIFGLYDILKELLVSKSFNAISFFNYLIKPLVTVGNFEGSWFLPCLFLAVLLTMLIIVSTRNNLYKTIIFLCIVGLIGLFLPKLIQNSAFHYLHNFYNIDVAFVACFFIGIAYIFKHHKFNNLVLAIISFIALIICFKFNTFIDMNNDKYGNKFLFIVGGLSGSYLTIFISSLIANRTRYMKIVLSRVGLYSLWILIFHGFILSWTSKIVSYIINNPPIISAISLFAAIIIPIIWTIIKRRIFNKSKTSKLDSVEVNKTSLK